jgi:hypothetical protein
MDAIPLGKSLAHDRSCAFLIKKEKIGIKNSKENANRLAVNRFLAIPDLQGTAMAPIPVITKTKPMQSKVSETSENNSARSGATRTPFN